MPSDYREDLLNVFHSSLVGSHLGVKKTLMSLQKQHYWPAISSDVKDFIRTCQPCQQFKSSNSIPANLMADYERKFKPGKAYSLDVVGPLPMFKKKNRFIFTAVDVADFGISPSSRTWTKFFRSFLIYSILKYPLLEDEKNCLDMLHCIFYSSYILSSIRHHPISDQNFGPNVSVIERFYCSNKK